MASGDGANDVNMIQAADIGIGISGQEGMQVWNEVFNFENVFVFFTTLTSQNISWLIFHLVVCRQLWRVILLYLVLNTWKNFSWFTDTGAIPDWPTWSFTSSIRTWWALHLHWSTLLLESTLFSSNHIHLMSLSGICEPAVLVPVLLRLLWHCHDRLLVDDFFQPLLHFFTAHHVWDNGQRCFSRDAAGYSWTVQDRTGCRGQWHSQQILKYLV